MKRRTFLKVGAISTAAIATSAGIGWTSIETSNETLTIKQALAKLDLLKSAKVTSIGEWNLIQIINHCAQSVEYSMLGFPEHKSALFKSSVGKWAFAAFSAKKKMHHPLNEVIPGAPLIKKEGDLGAAIQRFEESLLAFEAYENELEPHFAYGFLTKAEYEAAHVMHFNNHLLEIEGME